MRSEITTKRLFALGQDTRMRIFKLLLEAGPDGLPTIELAQQIGVAGPTLSNHLSILNDAALVRQRRNRRLLNYSIEPYALADLQQFFVESQQALDALSSVEVAA